MTELLVAVGVFVFFISVYGAVMAGGHLLAELQEETDQDPARESAPAAAPRLDGAVSPSVTS